MIISAFITFFLSSFSVVSSSLRKYHVFNSAQFHSRSRNSTGEKHFASNQIWITLNTVSFRHNFWRILFHFSPKQQKKSQKKKQNRLDGIKFRKNPFHTGDFCPNFEETAISRQQKGMFPRFNLFEASWWKTLAQLAFGWPSKFSLFRKVCNQITEWNRFISRSKCLDLSVGWNLAAKCACLLWELIIHQTSEKFLR